MTRLLCTGDNHLGKGIGLYPERLSEQEQVWRDTLELARSVGADAVLHAGDMFDQRRPGPDVMLAAERPLVEHSAEDGCPVIAICGNHDVPSQDGACGLDVLAEAGLLTLYREPGLHTVAGTTVAMLPWTPISRLLAMSDGRDREEVSADAAELLLMTARDLRGMGASVLMGHWSVSGSALPNGMDVGQLGGVVLPLPDLERIGFGRIVLGHIHRPQVLGDGTALYVGSPMTLDHGEEHTDHGCWMLQDDLEPVWLPLGSRKWRTFTFERAADVGFASMHVEDLIVRVRVTCSPTDTVDPAAIRAELLERGAHAVTGVHVDVARELGDRPVVVAEDISPADALEQWLAYRGINGSVGAAAIARAGRYLEGARS